MTVASEPELLPLVREAWTTVLPKAPFDPERSWEASGADSLRSLHLVLHLERALGRKVPFDLISRQMTPRDLAQRLAAPAAAPDVAAPRVFLVPGVFGDGPILADFRRSFGGSVRFHVVDLPDLDAPLAVHADLTATAALVADQIAREAGDAPILIAGFSFGGLVAFEAARALMARGLPVAFVGLLDALAGRSPASIAAVEQAERVEAPAPDVDSPAEGTVARMLPRRGEGMRAYAERLAFGIAMATRRIELARRITLAVAERLTQDQMIGRRKQVLGFGRMQAVERWVARPLDVPMLLACSDDGERGGALPHWTALCPRLEIVRLPGGHFDIFSPPALALLTPAFRDAVRKASAGHGDAPAHTRAAG